MLGERLLTVAGIYGPNASGKSNVLQALRWLREAVLMSMRAWDGAIPVEAFAFGDGASRTTEFTVELLVGDIRYEYSVELDQRKIHYEGLFHYPEKKRRRVFEREDRSLVLQRGLGDISGTRQLLTDQTLALSAAMRFDEPIVSNFAATLLGMRSRGLESSTVLSYAAWRSRSTDRWFDEYDRESRRRRDVAALFVDDIARGESGRSGYEKDRREALALLQLADLGIEDVMFVEETRERPGGGEVITRRRPRLVHRTSGEPTPLDFAAESNGTRNWYLLIGLLLSVLRSGSVLLLDEIDASLHPTLSAQLLHLFQDPITNPSGAQLIFTTHDTSLLNHLNRDEVWLTEKISSGATRLGALAEFAGERVRKSQNLEAAYLHGRFGALPDVDRTELLRVLGLIA